MQEISAAAAFFPVVVVGFVGGKVAVAFVDVVLQRCPFFRVAGAGQRFFSCCVGQLLLFVFAQVAPAFGDVVDGARRNFPKFPGDFGIGFKLALEFFAIVDSGKGAAMLCAVFSVDALVGAGDGIPHAFSG